MPKLGTWSSHPGTSRKEAWSWWFHTISFNRPPLPNASEFFQKVDWCHVDPPGTVKPIIRSNQHHLQVAVLKIEFQGILFELRPIPSNYALWMKQSGLIWLCRLWIQAGLSKAGRCGLIWASKAFCQTSTLKQLPAHKITTIGVCRWPKWVSLAEQKQESEETKEANQSLSAANLYALRILWGTGVVRRPQSWPVL